jgi:hypothetical protein
MINVRLRGTCRIEVPGLPSSEEFSPQATKANNTNNTIFFIF